MADPGRRLRVIDEMNALKATVEEGREIQAELCAALAGLAGETLKPCSDPCPGHFRHRTSAMFERGIVAYRRLAKPKDWPEPRGFTMPDGSTEMVFESGQSFKVGDLVRYTEDGWVKASAEDHEATPAGTKPTGRAGNPPPDPTRTVVR